MLLVTPTVKKGILDNQGTAIVHKEKIQIGVTNGVTLCNTIQLFHTMNANKVLQQQEMGSS